MWKVYFSSVTKARLFRKTMPGIQAVAFFLLILVHFCRFELKAQDLPDELYEELPGSAYRLLDQGLSHFESNRFDEALRFFNASIRKKPFYIEAYKYRARTRENLNDLDGALTDYNIILHFEPDLSEILFSRAVLRYRMKQYEVALQDLEALKNKPGFATNTVYFKTSPGYEGITGVGTLNTMTSEIHNYKALCLIELNRYKEAEDVLNDALLNDGENADLLLNRGILYEKMNRKEDAAADYARILLIYPMHEKASIYLSRTGIEVNNNDKLVLFNSILENNPEFIEALSQRAALHFSMKDYNKALKDYTDAIRLQPLNAEFWLSRGITHLKLKNYSLALSDVNKALTICPDCEKAYFNRGNIRHQQRDYTKAIEDYNLAIFYDKEYTQAYYNRAMARLNLKQKAEACSDLQIAAGQGMREASWMLRKHCLQP
ncbi:MAG: tetratricopeptide repeat protein [Cyclobacteriaceae bacterium]|nr:tetratricopeptide repeat protein [Cyclobacteriaceae bacterium]